MELRVGGPGSTAQTGVMLGHLRLGFGCLLPGVSRSHPRISEWALGSPFLCIKIQTGGAYGLVLPNGWDMSWVGWVCAWDALLEGRPPQGHLLRELQG